MPVLIPSVELVHLDLADTGNDGNEPAASIGYGVKTFLTLMDVEFGAKPAKARPPRQSPGSPGLCKVLPYGGSNIIS